MKNEYYYLAVSLFSILIMGCSNDSGIDTLPPGQMVPVGIRQLSVSGSGAVTRASKEITEGQMGVFRTTANNYPAQNNVPYSYSPSGWSPTNPDNVILVDHREAILVAYYPYQADMTSPQITLTSQAYSADKDLCYGTASSTINNTNPKGAIFNDMSHAYVRLKLSIKRHATNYVSGNCNITNVNIKQSTGNNFFVSRTLDISTGTNGGSATANGWTYALNTGNIAANATNTAYDVLVPPQPVSGGLTITLTIDGVNRAVTVPAAQFSNNLSAGNQYTISLTITDTAVTPSGNVSITDYASDSTTIKNNDPKEI